MLLVEDYTPLREAVAAALTGEGFAVDTSADGEEGLWYARSGEYDAILLDIALPKRDGLSILRALRDGGCRTPVLLLTARDSIDDRVTGLDLGADDYLVKPFALAELLARVRALVRRKYDEPDPVLRVRELGVDTVGRTVTLAGDPIELTGREYALLEYLVRRAGQVVTRAEIVEHLYDFNAAAESNVVDVYVGYLRRKLERPDHPPLIQTRRGQGYVLG